MAFSNTVLIKIKAQDEASRTIGGIGGKLNSVLKVGALAAGAAIVSIGVGAIKMAADFDKAFGEVTTLFDGSDKQVAALRQGVKDLAREMGVDATEATEALYSAISAGVDPNNAVDFLRENTKLAVAGVTDLNTAVDLTTTVLNSFGLEQAELTRVSDVMFATVQAGKTTIDELSAAIGQVAPTAAGAGVSIEGVGAALAELTAGGFSTAQATTGLNTALAELSKEGAIADKSFRELAGKSFQDFIAEGGNMVTAFRLMKKGADDMGVGVGDLFGSMDAGRAITSLLNDEGVGLAGTFDDMLNSSGATEEAFDKMNETFDRQFQLLQSQLKGVLLDLGEVILPILITAMATLSPWLQEHIPQGIAAIKAGFEAVRPTIETVAVVIGTFITFLNDHREVLLAAGITITTMLVPAFIAWAIAAGTAAVATIAAAAPVIAIGLVIGALVLGIILLIKHWDDVTAAMGTVVDAFKDVLETVEGLPVIGDIFVGIRDVVVAQIEDVLDFLNQIITVATDVLSFFTNIFTGDWEAAWTDLKDIATGILQLFLDFLQLGFIDDIVQVMFPLMFGDLLAMFTEKFTEIKDETIEKLGDILGAITDWITDTMTAVGTFFTDMVTGFATLFTDILTKLATWGVDLVTAYVGVWLTVANTFIFALTGIVNIVSGFFADIVQMGTDLGTDLANAIGSAFKAAWNAIASIINELIPDTFGIPGFDPPGPGSFPGFSIDLPNLPLFSGHQGGIVPGPPGQEVLALLQAGERVIPRPGALEDDSFGGGERIVQNINITVNVEDRSPAAIVHAIEMVSMELGERLALEGV